MTKREDEDVIKETHTCYISVSIFHLLFYAFSFSSSIFFLFSILALLILFITLSMLYSSVFSSLISSRFVSLLYSPLLTPLAFNHIFLSTYLSFFFPPLYLLPFCSCLLHAYSPTTRNGRQKKKEGEKKRQRDSRK